MKGNIYLYGCGGAGINIVASVIDGLNGLGDEFANFFPRYIDTTDKTIQHYEEEINNFYKITSTMLSQEELDGLAGERKNTIAVKEIMKNINQYVDGIKDNGKNDYHIIISSASGGSGSIISSLLLKALRQLDYNVIVVSVGDTSTYTYVSNTINTIVGYNQIAKQTKSAISIAYFDNSINGTTTPKSELAVNDSIKKFLSVLGMYLSGEVHDIDHQDMNNFFIPTRYKTFEVQPGIYHLSVRLTKLDDSNAILARTIIRPGQQDVKIEVPLLNNKVGVASPTHIKTFKENLFPVFLQLEKNTMNSIVKELKDEFNKLEKLKEVENSELEALDDSIDDETGLVL